MPNASRTRIALGNLGWTACFRCGDRVGAEVWNMTTSRHLTAIKTVPAYELVSDEIQRAVHLGLLMPGDRLPSERDLAQQLGVARMTVREAIRFLARDGHVIAKRGRRGGTWIRARDVSNRDLVHLAADADRSIGDVFEYREIIERASARLAAERATPKDVQKLRRLCSAMDKVIASHSKLPVSSHLPHFLALDSQFHIEIARIAGNHFICDAVELALAKRYGPFRAVMLTLVADANDDHNELLIAIAAGDGAGAERLMSAHVSSTRSSLLSMLNRHVRAQTSK